MILSCCNFHRFLLINYTDAKCTFNTSWTWDMYQILPIGSIVVIGMTVLILWLIVDLLLTCPQNIVVIFRSSCNGDFASNPIYSCWIYVRFFSLQHCQGWRRILQLHFPINNENYSRWRRRIVLRYWGTSGRVRPAA